MSPTRLVDDVDTTVAIAYEVGHVHPADLHPAVAAELPAGAGRNDYLASWAMRFVAGKREIARRTLQRTGRRDQPPAPSVKKIMSITFARLYRRAVSRPVLTSSVGTRCASTRSRFSR